MQKAAVESVYNKKDDTYYLFVGNDQLAVVDSKEVLDARSGRTVTLDYGDNDRLIGIEVV